MFRISATGVASVIGCIAISLSLEQQAAFIDKATNLHIPAPIAIAVALSELSRSFIFFAASIRISSAMQRVGALVLARRN
jgi:hypothetical protein